MAQEVSAADFKRGLDVIEGKYAETHVYILHEGKLEVDESLRRTTRILARVHDVLKFRLKSE